MPSLADKVILVTGAGSGLGAAIVLGCVAEGAKVLAADINGEGLAATVAKAGGDVRAHVCDLADPTAGAGAVAAALAAFGRLDGLANAAAILGYHHFAEVTPQVLNRIVAVNLTGAFHLCQAAMPELVKTKGALVNIGSSGAVIGTAYTIPYSMTKAAIVHMTKCLAMEFIHTGVRINVVSPGPMRTNISRDIVKPEGLDPELAKRPSGLRPPADPADVADVVVYALSERSRAIYGAVLLADGGVTTG